MKKILALAAGGMALAMLSVFARPAPASAAITDWEKGVSVVPTSPTDFAGPEMLQSLQELQRTGANFATLNVPYAQDDATSTQIYPGPTTPTDAALVTAITEAHNLGLQVQISIHDHQANSFPWSALINPDNRDAWFTSYEAVLTHYAQLAQANHVEQLCLGAELINMTRDDVNTTNTQHWVNIIADLRKIYSGKLTYSAQWGNGGWQDEKNGIQFWDKLDLMGLTEYPDLDVSDNDEPGMEKAWQSEAQNILAWQQKWNKPFIIGEIGYHSANDTTYSPWQWDKPDFNDQAQANAYQAFLNVWNQYPQMVGVHFWFWEPNPAAGGPGNTGYTPQNKTAEKIMTQYFGGSGNPQSANLTPPFSINVGSGSLGQWQGDQNFYGGDVATTDHAIAGQTSPNVYQSERWGNFSYTFPNLPNGNYKITLKFAEIYWSQPGQRVFNVIVNGQTMLANLDIVRDVGAPFTPDDKVIYANVSNNTLTISFQGIVDNAKLSGLVIEPATSTPTSTPFFGSPISLPGRLHFSDFDNGGEQIAYVDNSPGNLSGDNSYRVSDVDLFKSADPSDPNSYAIGWAQGGEWEKYTVNASSTGDYNFSFRVASQGAGGTFRLESDGTDITGPLTVPDTGGWETYQNITKNGIFLTAGMHVLRLVMDQNGSTSFVGNFNYADISLAAVSVPPPPPPSPPPPSSPPLFTGTSNSQTVSPNTTVPVPITIANSGGPAQSVIVDTEIYDTTNHQVFQNFQENVNFSASSTQSFSSSWTPQTTGQFTIKIGVFSTGWSQNLFWNNDAGTLTVGNSNQPPPQPPPSPPTTTPPSSLAIDIWWPIQNANIGGPNVPFKGLVENLNLPQYDMFWQVDGGGLVLMTDNQQDYPHKEFDVDLTGWTWKGSGPFHLNFVAKDKSGNVIAQKPVDVTIWH